MMKKFISLCLVVTMLLGMVAMTVSAEAETPASVLTEAQQAALAAITVEQVAESGVYNLNDIGPWYYAQAGIDVETILDKSVSNTLNSLFNSNGVNTASPYWPMLVADSWGGTQANMEAAGQNDLANVDFQIGDLLIVRTKRAGASAGHYWVALYQGVKDDVPTFVVETRSGCPDFTASASELFAMKDGTTRTWTTGEGEEATQQSVEIAAWQQYAVLRPANYLVKHNFGVNVGTDIAMTYQFNGLPYETVDVEIYKGAELIETRMGLEVTDGSVEVFFNGLTPADVDTEYTVSIVNSKFSMTHSVLEYCEGALTTKTMSNETWSLIVDLLNYCAAAQKYLQSTDPTVRVTANTTLTEMQKLFATEAPAVDTLKTNESVGPQTMDIVWTASSLALGESVAYRFYYTGDKTDVDIYVDDKLYEDAYFCTDGNGTFVEIGNRTPAELRTDMTIYAKKGDQVVSATKTFSAERYASSVLNSSASDDVKALVNSILCYSNSAVAFGDGVSTGTFDIVDDTGVTTIAGATNKFDLYRKLLNLADQPVGVMRNGSAGGTGLQAGLAYSAVKLDIVSGSLYNLDADWVDYATVTLGIFDKDGTTDTNKITRTLTDEDGAYIANFANMYVEGTLGGTRISYTPKATMADVCANIEVGDIVVMCVATAFSQPHYLHFVYVGNNKFIGGACKTNGYTARYVVNGFTVDEMIAFCNLQGDYTNRLDTGSKNYSNLTPSEIRCFYVLRPSQLFTNAQ